MNNVDLITESLSAFEDQYRISHIIAEICYDMSLKGQEKNYVSLQDNFKNCIIKSVNLEIIYNAYTNYYAQFINLNENGCIFLKVFFPFSDVLNCEKNKTIRKIKNCISHELMHGNIFLQRLNHGKELNDFYIDYEKWSIVRQTEDENTLIYKFAYAIYATFYQEVQAFTSQATTEFEALYNKNTLSNNEIRNGLKYCTSYQIYNNILNDLIPTLKEMLINNDEQYLIEPLKKYGINIDKDFINLSIKKFTNVSEKALRNILRNIMLIANGVGETLEEVKKIIKLKY